jgi:tetratricopeptide (TPR) repeat protein
MTGATALVIAMAVADDGARAAPGDKARPEAQIQKTPDPEEIAEQQKEVLTSLLERLEKEEDADAAKKLEGAIMELWQRSGSPTVDILMEQAVEAANEKKTDTAIELLDAVVELAPDFAEGWNKRATVFYMRDEYTRSMIDIQKVLSLEPRHFGALSGLGMIMREFGEDKAALAAFREALKHHPHLEGAVSAVKELSVSVEGRGI